MIAHAGHVSVKGGVDACRGVILIGCLFGRDVIPENLGVATFTTASIYGAYADALAGLESKAHDVDLVAPDIHVANPLCTVVVLDVGIVVDVGYGLVDEIVLNVIYDDTGSIGKRYRRCDAIGTPLAITVDDETINNGTVTVRDRDTMKQVTIKLEEVEDYINNVINK